MFGHVHCIPLKRVHVFKHSVTASEGLDALICTEGKAKAD